MKLLLRDTDAAVVAALSAAFADFPDVDVTQGNILLLKADAIVSPANSFGSMGGGIDRIYVRHFGVGVRAALQARIRAEHGGELPVGEALCVPTGDARIPCMISAPTMRKPGAVTGSRNAYRAMLAALTEAARHPTIVTLLCPGLCTKTGRMSPGEAAAQMREAYDTYRTERSASTLA